MIKRSLLLLCTFAPSWLRLMVWRLLGFTVGPHCRVGMFSVVVAESIELGPGCVIEPLTFIYRPHLLRMGERSRIASFVTVVGRGGNLSLASQNFIALGCLIDTSENVQMGARSQIGPRSILYTHGGTGLTFSRGYPRRSGPICIGEDVWIAMQTVIQPGISIGNRVIVLPGLAIRKDVPDGKAMIPVSQEYRLAPIGGLLLSVTDEFRLECLQSLFRMLASHWQAEVDCDADDWKMETARGQQVYLMRSQRSRSDTDEKHADQLAVWTLFEEHSIWGVPTFCFARLTVFGPRTSFAEKIADFLCVRGGVHFLFERSDP